MPPTKTQKSPELRELEKRRARRVEDVIAASRLVRHARNAKASETRRLARDHDLAVDDLEEVERELERRIELDADRDRVLERERSEAEEARAEGLAVAMEPTT